MQCEIVSLEFMIVEIFTTFLLFFIFFYGNEKNILRLYLAMAAAVKVSSCVLARQQKLRCCTRRTLT